MWNLQKIKNLKKKTDLYNLFVRMDFIKKKKSFEDYRLQSKSRSLLRNLVNTICLCMKTFIKVIH